MDKRSPVKLKFVEILPSQCKQDDNLQTDIEKLYVRHPREHVETEKHQERIWLICWIEAMLRNLSVYRLRVWELVDKPYWKYTRHMGTRGS
ncbi:hypothetical protein Tco_0842602 [Tanacetum coccineum]|uniref:Uncharacterized protein n=1 Tax=Tanacetum coccineum TaxID=301880 RepID=A0ABQ5B083_9ASTR